MVKTLGLASVVLTSTLLGQVVAVPGKAAMPNYWFSFGDSYSQTWFNHTGTPPAVGNPLGNPPYPGWTATGGENWVGYVTTKYNNSLVLTWNYAYGGAVIDKNLVTPWQPAVLTLIDQVAQFLSYAAKKPAVVPWTSANALFSIWIGINDIGNSWWLEGSDAFNDRLLDAYFAQVKKLYDAGGRNFLFVTVPPIERTPAVYSQPESTKAQERAVIANFNGKLLDRITKFKATNNAIKTWVWDSNKTFNKILDNPLQYGFRDNFSYGTGSPDLFWGNDYHPSTYADKWFGEEVGRQVLANTPW